MMYKYLVALLVVQFALLTPVQARDYFVDSRAGDDSQKGTSETEAWKSLKKANQAELEAGDRLLLKRGSRFNGGLKLELEGTEKNPIVIGAYGEGDAPQIDAKGYFAGVHLLESHYVTVRDLEITADGGKTRDGFAPTERYGVFVRGIQGFTSNITLENLKIYKIYPEVAGAHEGKNATTYLGTAIHIEGGKKKSSTDFVVRNCHIEEVGFKAIRLKHLQRAEVLDNIMINIGGPAIQPGIVDDLVVRGNWVDGSGSSQDPRMHARGSGIWPWGCDRMLIEKNTFMHARGKGDSCGIHIDFNCNDVVVQYNLSIDNEGGFIEILGNNRNCAYRYNISVNDGARVKGKDGAYQEGKILWVSGYHGYGNEDSGPYNSYIYNNTIYVGPKSRSCFSISPSVKGLLIANNIFHIMGRTKNVQGDQGGRASQSRAGVRRSLMKNNVYYNRNVLPGGLPIKEKREIIGDPEFEKPGGMKAEDYIPQNIALIKDRGIRIKKLDGDKKGLSLGLDVKEDFFGNPIVGRPDIGAIEVSHPVKAVSSSDTP